MESLTADRESTAVEGAASTSGPASRFRRSVAIVVGVDRYGDGIPDLCSAVADAKAIAEALQADHEFEIRLLVDEEARLPDLLELLRVELPARLGSDDRLLFYFAGHGLAVDGDAGPAGYLLPANARRAEPDGFLPMHVLHDDLARLPVRHALVILDCCFAGTFRWSTLRDVEHGVNRIYRERYERYVESAAWQVLTSTSADQLAFDRLNGDRGDRGAAHSPFARALLDGLTGAADYTGDNLITASELAMFVAERVAPAAEAAGRRQVPQLFPLDRHNCGEFVFQVPRRMLELEPAPALAEEANPYRGLQSFREQDRALFFGRTEVTRRLVDAISAQRLTVVVGPSGCGKSSVVQAGAVPVLREAGWNVLPIQRPGRAPLAVLQAWTRTLGDDAAAVDPVGAWLGLIASRAGEGPCLVIIDQLEELLTHRTPEAERIALLGALATALGVAPQLRVVVTVRSDSEPQFHSSPLGAWWAEARFVVPGLTRHEVREVIERPATTAVVHFEPSRLVDHLIDDVALVPGPLPLLSFALSELYRRCWTRWQVGERDRALRETDYRAMGSVAGALTQRASALHDRLVLEDPAYAMTIRNVVVRMVAIVGGELARRRVPREELAYADPAENQRVADVLQRFQDARLISLGSEPGDDGTPRAYAEPAHDELVRGWTQVRQWVDEIDEPPGTRALLGSLGVAVHAWEHGGRAKPLLWADGRVKLAQELGRIQPSAFNAVERHFVRASARRIRARRTLLVGITSITIAVLSTALLYARSQASRAEAEATRAGTEAARATANEATAKQETARKTEALALATARELEVRQERDRASKETARANKETARATTSEAETRDQFERAETNAAEARSQRDAAMREKDANSLMLAASYEEAGRQLAVKGHALEATPYLVEARRLGSDAAPLHVLFAVASRSLPLATFEHTGEIRSAVFSRDQRRIATASDDGEVRLWDATTGERVAPVLERSEYTYRVVFSPDNSLLLGANVVHQAQLWDTRTGRIVGALSGAWNAMSEASFSPDSKRVVTAYQKQAAIWEVHATARPVAVLPHTSTVNVASFSPNGARIVTGDDRGVRLWDAATGHLLATYFEGQGAVYCASFSRDGAYVVSTGKGHNLRVWSAADGQLAFPPRFTSGGGVGDPCPTFNYDGTRIVTPTGQFGIDVLTAHAGEKAWSLSAGRDSAMTSAAFSGDGTRVLTVGVDQTARVWVAAHGEPAVAPLQHPTALRTAAIDFSGSRVVTVDTRRAYLWALPGSDLAEDRFVQAKAVVVSAAFSADGLRLVTTFFDGARVWDWRTGAPVTSPLAHGGHIAGARLSANGSRVLTFGGDRVRIWEVDRGGGAGPILMMPGQVNDAELSSDGARVVTASGDNTVSIWDAATGQRIAGPWQHDSTAAQAAFSPDGTRVVAIDGLKASVREIASGKEVMHVDHSKAIVDVNFSSDGRRIVTASFDASARVWDAASGKPITRPLVHKDAVVRAQFSRDGTRILTRAFDATVRIWDAASGQPLCPPIRQQYIHDIALSPDASLVATAGGGDAVAQLWDARTGQPVMPAIAHVLSSGDTVTFSPDGRTLLVANGDNSPHVVHVPWLDGTIDDWAAIAQRSPYVLLNGVLAPRDSTGAR